MSHYETLGVPPTATADEIKQAYRRLATRYHPDKNLGEAAAGAKAMFQEVQAAYDVLGDPERRKLYDETGLDRPPPSAGDEAANLLMQLFRQALEADNGMSPIDIAKRMLSDIIADLERNRQIATKKVARLQRRSGKFKSKGDRNLIQMLIDQQLRELDAEVIRLEHLHGVALHARTHCDDYESLEEARLPNPAPTIAQQWAAYHPSQFGQT